MAMNGKEFKDWAARLSDEDRVAVDDGGLCLVVQSEGEGPWSEGGVEGAGPWCEIGGVPLEDEE